MRHPVVKGDLVKMQHTTSGSKLTELIVATFRLNGAIINTGDKLVKDLGLTSARWQVLGTIIDEPATVSEIARKMGLSRQNVQRISNRLIKDGFIETADNPAHRKAKLCTLSTFGKKTMKEVTRRQRVWANEISKDIDMETLTLAITTMEKCRQKITDG